MSQSLFLSPSDRPDASPAPLLRTLRRVLFAWAGLALAVGASGLLEDPPLFLMPFLIWSGPIAFVTAYARSPRFREALLGVDLRPAVLFHLVRVVAGVGFLWLHARGQLTGAFALSAGWGDIVVGLAAIPAALALPASTPARRLGVLLWNAVALLDILMVVVNANRLMFLGDDPQVLTALTRFPFVLLPLFIVPQVLITHFLVMARLWAPRPGGSPQEAA
jgi:hypothetical protein